MRNDVNSVLKWAIAAGCAVLLCAASPRAAAQGCAMCYQTAAASATPGRDALREGIWILLLPAVSLFLGIFLIMYRRRNPPA